MEKKILWTLDINEKDPDKSFEPEMTAITFPLMHRYADKIGAEFRIIKERKFSEWPIPCEKFQIGKLSEEAGNDWNIYFDADTMIHPDFFDVTSVLHKDTTVSYGTDFAPQRFRPDKYFMRDGRMTGKGNWCAIVSDWCLDYWHFPPDDLTPAQAVANVFPLQDERNPEGIKIDTIADPNNPGKVIQVSKKIKKVVVDPPHLIDDYTVSRNIARYGLKHMLIPEILARYGRPAEANNLAHQYLLLPEMKILWMQETIKQWGVQL